MKNTSNTTENKTAISFIRTLCNDQSSDEILVIEDNFRNYLKLVWQIAQRTQNNSS
jgi:hypothetical protein